MQSQVSAGPAPEPVNGTGRIPVAAFLPMVALSFGIQRYAHLHGAGGLPHAAGVHLAAVAVLVATHLLRRRNRDARTPKQNAEAGASFGVYVRAATLLAVATLLILWAMETLSYAATGLAALIAAVLALRKASDRSLAAEFIIPILLGGVGVLLLVFGRNAGLGLQTLPSLYLPLSRGPRQPDASTVTALSALMVAGMLWTGLWRRAAGYGYRRRGDHAFRTLLLVAPSAALLVAGTLASGARPVIGTWTLPAGIALAVTVHGTMRLAALVTPAAAGTAVLGGCLSSALVSRVHYGNSLTSTMLAGAFLVAASLAISRQKVRLYTGVRPS